jgi:hypothetical protein
MLAGRAIAANAGAVSRLLQFQARIWSTDQNQI